MLHYLIVSIDKFLPFKRVSAHCDIPCKIYDPISAQLAALSVVRFIDQINEITTDTLSDISSQAKLVRLINEKEKHAEQVKQHIRVIWGDYFKQPQFEQVTGIHELAHDIMLAGSACKQSLERHKALSLLDKVNQFADAFWQTKGVDTYTAVCPYPPAENVIYPNLSAK